MLMTKYEIHGFRRAPVYIDGEGDRFHLARGSKIIGYGAGFFEETTGSNNTIVIDGTIDASQIAVQTEGESTSVTIGKSGAIHSAAGVLAQGDGSSVVSLGTIYAASFGISMDGVGGTATNKGTITAFYGLYAAGDQIELVNGKHGRIEAFFAGFITGPHAGDDTIFYNHGTVIAAEKSYAAYGGDEANTLISDGRMTGEIWLGDGFNIVNLTGGRFKGQITGGADDDMLITDNARYQLFEGEDRGIDTVISSVSYTLNDNVEDLTLAGKHAIRGTGNALANGLTGDKGDNRLFGLAGADIITGGAGDDVMTGGTEADTFVFLPKHGRDVITDFELGLDHMIVSTWLGTADFTEIMKHVRDVDVDHDGQGDQAVVSFDHASITLLGIHSADLRPSDFNTVF